MTLELSAQRDGAALSVALSGEVNTMTAPELAALLERELDGVESLTLDFAGCDYVSSAGLRVLLATVKRMRAAGGDMRLANVGENFMDVLENTGLDAVFDVR